MRPTKEASLKAVIAAISTNFLVTTLKFIGWIVYPSPSLLAEAIHSLADCANQVMLFVGIRHGAGKPTLEFPLGKGHARYIWNLISAIGIFFVGFGYTTYHGFSSLLHPVQTASDHPVWVPISILVFSIILESYSLFVAFQAVNEARGEKSIWQYVRNGDDPTMVAVLLEDSVAVFGVALALAGLYLSHLIGSHAPDAFASIFIGGLLGFMAVVLAIANGRLLMGMSAGQDWEDEVRHFVEAYPSVERVVKLQTSVLAPGRFRLVLEVEFHGEILLNRQMIERDSARIRDGDDPAPILVETAARAVRTVGREINRLEAELHAQFVEIAMIDLEVN